MTSILVACHAFSIQNVFNFPTLSDVYKYAAYDGLGDLQRARERQKN
jgi:stage III sporulation protein SpoIIIAA